MFDLVAFHSSAPRNGFSAIIPAAGEDIYQVANTYYIVPRGRGHITSINVITAAIANCAGGQVKRAVDENYLDVRLGLSDQTGARKTMFTKYGFSASDMLHARVDNGNNAQVDSVVLALARDGIGFREEPQGQLAENTKWVFGSHGSTMVANTWTRGACTWQPVLERSRAYKIRGMICQGATAYAMRLIHKGGSPNVGDRPGTPAHDTTALSIPYYGDFGTFYGDQPPDVQGLCSGADTAGYIGLLVENLG